MVGWSALLALRNEIFFNKDDTPEMKKAPAQEGAGAAGADRAGGEAPQKGAADADVDAGRDVSDDDESTIRKRACTVWFDRLFSQLFEVRTTHSHPLNCWTQPQGGGLRVGRVVVRDVLFHVQQCVPIAWFGC